MVKFGPQWHRKVNNLRHFHKPWLCELTGKRVSPRTLLCQPLACLIFSSQVADIASPDRTLRHITLLGCGLEECTWYISPYLTAWPPATSTTCTLLPACAAYEWVLSITSVFAPSRWIGGTIEAVVPRYAFLAELIVLVIDEGKPLPVNISTVLDSNFDFGHCYLHRMYFHLMFVHKIITLYSL